MGRRRVHVCGLCGASCVRAILASFRDFSIASPFFELDLGFLFPVSDQGAGRRCDCL